MEGHAIQVGADRYMGRRGIDLGEGAERAATLAVPVAAEQTQFPNYNAERDARVRRYR